MESHRLRATLSELRNVPSSSNPRAHFTAHDCWAGGHYQLALCYRSRGGALVEAAVRALWSDRCVGPCHARHDLEPEDQAALDPAQLGELTDVYGVCLLGPGVPVATRSIAVLYDEGPAWVYFGFPMGSLGRAFAVGAYPFEDRTSLAWRSVLDVWLRELGTRVYPLAPFDSGLVGHEPEESIVEGLEPHLVPARRWEGILLPRDGEIEWYPPTEGAPITLDRPR